LTGGAPDVADRLGLPLDVGEEGPTVTPLQSFPDQGAQDDLQAHRQLERGRRLPRKDSGPVQGVLGENEENSRFIHDITPPGAGRSGRPASGLESLSIFIFEI
jgi:hypothetical protein